VTAELKRRPSGLSIRLAAKTAEKAIQNFRFEISKDKKNRHRAKARILSYDVSRA
jgi:hypothetical protein